MDTKEYDFKILFQFSFGRRIEISEIVSPPLKFNKEVVYKIYSSNFILICNQETKKIKLIILLKLICYIKPLDRITAWLATLPMTFHKDFIYPHNFCQQTAEKKSLKEILLFSYFALFKTF